MSKMSGAHFHCSTSHTLQTLQTEVHRKVSAATRPTTVPPTHVPTPPTVLSLLLTLFVLAPAVATPLSCSLSAPQNTMTFTVTITVVTSTTLPAPGPHPPATPSVRSSNPHRHPLGCPSLPYNRCSVGIFSAHCTSRKCRHRTPTSPMQPHCRLYARSSQLFNWFLESPLHQPSLCGAPSFPVGKRSGGGSPDDGTVNPLLCRSLRWFVAIQLSSSLKARWGCARRVHKPRQLFRPT